MQLYSIAMKKIDNFNFVGNVTTKNLNLNFTLMYTDLQIDCIRAFGDKELKEGCLIKTVEDYGTIFHYRDISWPWAPEMSDIRARYYVKDDPRIHTWSRWMRKPEILWSEPNLFPDVAKKLREKGYNLEVLQWDTLTSIIRISRWDIKKPQIIEYKPCLPLLEQPKAMESLLALIK